jgi:hypothetical protein
MIITFFRSFLLPSIMYINKKGRLSAKLQALPGLAGLPPIIPRRGSIDSGGSDSASSSSEYHRGLERATPYLKEGCMVTKRFNYCNRLSHFVNAASPKDKYSPDVVRRLSSWKCLPGC